MNDRQRFIQIFRRPTLDFMGQAKILMSVEDSKRVADLLEGTTAADGAREALAIAGVIDPVAFDPISLNDTHPGWQHRRETAIDTANKILALRAALQPGGKNEQ